MKRKTGNREGWPRIQSQDYLQQIIKDEVFDGYVTLIKFNEVVSPLMAKFTSKPICLVENGSYMMQHIPFNEKFALTTFISPDWHVMQWYFDMTNGMGVENEIPYFDDLYLDLIVVPTGEIIEKDIDELEEALDEGMITKEQYDMAWTTFNDIKEAIQSNNFPLLEQCKKHFEQLVSNFRFV